jgi:hypothetical protein
MRKVDRNITSGNLELTIIAESSALLTLQD